MEIEIIKCKSNVYNIYYVYKNFILYEYFKRETVDISREHEHKSRGVCFLSQLPEMKTKYNKADFNFIIEKPEQHTQKYSTHREALSKH